MNDHERLAASGHAADILKNQPFFTQSKHIACYLAYQNEFDAGPIIRLIWEFNKKCYLPILSEAKSLYFVRYNENDPLELNTFSILEPQDKAKKILAEDLDLVITPLLAFDAKGHRLGTGGGYYDRSFAFLYSNMKKKPLMIGLAYSFQAAECLPTDPWDIALDGVITEEKYIFYDKC